MKLLCVKDVVMIPDGDIAFKQGQYYEFGINSSGEIHRFTDYAHVPCLWARCLD